MTIIAQYAWKCEKCGMSSGYFFYSEEEAMWAEGRHECKGKSNT